MSEERVKLDRKIWINNLDVNTDFSGKTWTMKYCEKDVQGIQFLEKLKKLTSEISPLLKIQEERFVVTRISHGKLKNTIEVFVSERMEGWGIWRG